MKVIKPKYLLDANVLIDYTSKRFTSDFEALFHNLLQTEACSLSSVACVEALSKITDKAPLIESLIEVLPIYPFEEDHIFIAASLRRQYGFKLPDSMIAATAIHNEQILITSDLRSFHLVDQLQLLRPALVD